MSDVRLLKVVVQPVFVAISEDGVQEITGKPIDVPGKDWSAFGASAFGPEDMQQVAAQYDAQNAATPPPPALDDGA